MKSLLVLTFSVFLALLLASSLHAQVGNQNPSGVAGIFNGEAGGRPVDPYTGNATTSITDISVAGAVGEYPLALVRTASSRSIAYNYPFGLPGAWNHNYNWLIGDSPTSTTSNFYPTRYVVAFPDGRVETFRAVTWDTTCYRVRLGNDTPASSASSGVRERFVPLNLSTMLAKLMLPDGGQVELSATQHSYQQNGHTYFYYKYRATAIIDPYGVRTTFTYDGQGRLSTVAQPQQTSRSLQFSYRPNNSLVIDHVTEVINGSNRRTVQYNYSNISPGGTNYLALTSVAYYGQSQWTASYQYRAPNVAPVNGIPLLSTCNEPTYAGPMHKIAYVYRTADNYTGSHAVYGQISSENYYDGTNVGAAVSTLTVSSATNRTETRGDGATRSFVYNGQGYVTWASDFLGRQSNQGYDAKNYINLVTNFNRITTNYTSDALTGNVTQIQYPATPEDTMPQSNQGSSVSYTYSSASCADQNNRDANNPYYVCTATDEAGHLTQFKRDTSHRVIEIDYPDGGYETFSYNGFGQVLYHRMTTGGTETFTYDTRGLKQTYRDPGNGGYNPSLRYQYDCWDRVTDISDAFGAQGVDPAHTTSFSYNLRGQVLVTTLPEDVNNGNTRHTITNVYNPDGTLQSKTDELSNMASYSYDDYRRPKSVTPPARGDGTGTHTTNFYYDANGTSDDYRDIDSNVTWVKLPSGKKTKTVYDDNRRKASVTVGYGTADAATTSYLYDGMGNVTWLTNPRGVNTQTIYDERNRPSEIHDVYGHVTYFKYDTAGRKKSITRANGQTITYDTFDAMNRVTQQTTTQSPDPSAVTQYSYYPSGLLNTMKDPRLVATNSQYKYTYEYDTMGRKKKLTYPPDPANVQRTEQFTYDAMGRLQTSINRDGKTQTFTYDALNRLSYFTWTDGTPRVDFAYDAASRLVEIDNANATISRAYWEDNLLGYETETPTGGSAKTAMYFYDADANLDRLYMPGYTFQYQYSGRDQLSFITDYSTGAQISHYVYDENGNVTSRYMNPNNSSSYTYDALDRVTNITHSLFRDTRTLDYDYDSVGNRKWTKRDGGNGDAFLYDNNDQVIALRLGVTNPETPPPRQTIFYDANGNRTSFALTLNGPTDTYSINNLNQYSARNNINADYDSKGNLTQGFDGSAYTFDAQNRLLTAPGISFKYDGLNRQVSRTTNGVTTYSIWDGWNLAQEYHMSGNNVVEDASYLYGVTGLVKNLKTNNYYYQDGSGSTSHLANNGGILLEWYRYDLQGTPIFYDANNNQLSASNYSVRHLFTGQQWYKEIGLYDLRNRFYSPDIGRFLQADPSGFIGDPTNLYRYCANNPLKAFDPSGLDLIINLYPAGSFGWNYNHVGIGVVGVNNNQTVSLYPKNGLFIGFGTVKDDEGDPLRTIIMKTSKEQDQMVLDFIANVTNNPGLYTLWNNNCTRFVEGALITAGIKNVPTAIKPTKLMRSLQNRAGRKINRIVGNRIRGLNPRENVGPVGFMPWGNPLGPGGYGPGAGPGQIDFGPGGNLGGPIDSGPGPNSYEPGPIEPFWNDVPEWDPFFNTDPLWFDPPDYSGFSGDETLGSGAHVQ